MFILIMTNLEQEIISGIVAEAHVAHKQKK
jgi:hypothetical protein